MNKLIIDLQKEKSGLILFSSGSTGKPKAMIHNLDSLLGNFIQNRVKNIKFCVLMFDHIGGLNTLFNCLGSRMPVAFQKKRNIRSL